MSRIRLGLGPHECYLLDIDGFFAPLKALLDNFLAEGFIAPADLERFHFPESVQELAELVAQRQANPAEPLVTATELNPGPSSRPISRS